MGKKQGILKRILKITGIVLLTIIILVVGFVAFVFLDTRDIAKIDDSDLRLKKLNVAQEDNSFDLVNSIDSNVKNVNNTDLANWVEGKDWDDNKVKQTLIENQTALAIFDQVVTKKYFIDPKYDPKTADFSSVVSGMRASREISRLATVQSEEWRREGKYEEAFNEAEKVIIFGQKIGENSDSVIQSLVGIMIKNIGLDQVTKVVNDNKLSASFLNSKKSELGSYKSLAASIEHGLEGEYTIGANTFDEMTDKAYMEKQAKEQHYLLSPVDKLTMRQSFYYKVNKTHQMHYELFKQVIEKTTDACVSGDNKIKVDKISDVSMWIFAPNISNWKLIFTENALGKGYISAMQDGFLSVKEKRCDSEAKFDTLLEKMSK